MKRLFIGVRILPTKKTLDFYSKLKSKLKDEKIKWVSLEKMRITLKFLGNTDATLLPSINAKLKQIATRVEPFSINIQGLGRFKNQRDTKVIWLGISNTNILNALANEIDNAMKDFGFDSENRPFNPHLTLGRVRYQSNEDYITQLIIEYNGMRFQSTKICEFFLVESVLQQCGSKYNIIKEITLQ